MAMNQGDVQINGLTGATTVKTGIAGTIFDALDGAIDYQNLDITNPLAFAVAREQIAAQARAISLIIPHIQSFAQVSTTVAVSSVSGVTTGPGASGPGSGTGTGTVA